MATETFFGTVRRFNPDAGWGFIAREEGMGDIFFHIQDGVGFDPQETEPVGNSNPPFRVPRDGDRICFQIIGGKSGKTKASPWGLMTEWERAWRAVQDRSAAA